MNLPDLLIFEKPIHVWLGFLALLILILQIMVGKQIIKLPFWTHKKLIWVILIIVVLLHMLYGIQLYF